MAIQTRYAGDAQGVNNVDAKTDGTLDTVIGLGLTKNPIGLKITSVGTLSADDSATGGLVEAILKQIAIDSTITAYQVSSDRISVLLEATGSTDAVKQTRVRTVSANAVVSSTGGIKFA